MPPTTVLVVDDEQSIRLLCRVNLELEGYRVLEAGRIDDARDLLAAEDVDIVLLDVHVGTDDGLSLLDELRESRPAISTVLVTGTYELDAAAREGADAVLPKPFELEELSATVSRLAGSTSEA